MLDLEVMFDKFCGSLFQDVEMHEQLLTSTTITCILIIVGFKHGLQKSIVYSCSLYCHMNYMTNMNDMNNMNDTNNMNNMNDMDDI